MLVLTNRLAAISYDSFFLSTLDYQHISYFIADLMFRNSITQLNLPIKLNFSNNLLLIK
jgi:hypothetical protein